MVSIALNSPAEIASDLAKRLRARRLESNLSQEGLATRAGVTLASLKRFERTGKIALESLVKLAFALDALDGFEALFPSREYASIDEVLERQKTRKRGGIK